MYADKLLIHTYLRTNGIKFINSKFVTWCHRENDFAINIQWKNDRSNFGAP